MELFQSDMSSEFKRYATFNGFQTPAGIWPLQLAQAGFYRSVHGDNQVICFACGLHVDVAALDKGCVMEVHRDMSPNCSFVGGLASNQPVPAVDPRAALEWLHQNFIFDGIQDLLLQNLPQIHDSASATAQRMNSSPIPTISFSRGETESLPTLPLLSDLNTVEQPGLLTQIQNPDLPSLPLDLLCGLENATLTSVSPAAQFQAGNLSQSTQPFNSILGGGPGEILVTDGEPLDPVGEYPPSLMAESDLMSSNTPRENVPTTELRDGRIEQKNTVTYGDLGIVVQRPKREEYATYDKRLETFDRWMGQPISQSKESIAKAGFYYAGYSDCCRCFFCGGGLKSWEPEDHPWVEHARWFKDCPFVLTNKGKGFVEAVQSLARTNRTIRIEDVQNEMSHLGYSVQSDQDTEILPNDVDIDMSTRETEEAAVSELERLQEENESLRRPDMCKICHDEEVSIVYLPCAHLVTCGLCSSTVKKCPICREIIEGQIRIERPT